MKDLAAEIAQLNAEQKRELIKRLDKMNVDITLLLIDSSTKSTIEIVADDGSESKDRRSTIDNKKMNEIMNEINRIEKEYGKELYTGIISAMTLAASSTIRQMIKVEDISKQAKVNVEKLLGQTVTIGDKTLKQRTQIEASDTLADIRKTIRQGILGNKDVIDIVNDVRRSFNDTTWKIERMVESEVYMAYRFQFGQTASANGYDWIRLHESFPRSKRRRQHRCYELANADKYGKGAGVYKSTDSEIYLPHPQCTSWLEVVEVDV